MKLSANPVTYSRGAATVEAALLLIPLMLVVGGLIDGGYYLKRSTLAVMASRAAARAESVVGHNLVVGADAPIACEATSCGGSCSMSAFATGHQAACAFLRDDLGGRFDPEDWMISISASPVLNEEIGLPAPMGNAAVRRSAHVTVFLNPERRACLACFLGQYLNVGVAGESSYLLHR